MAKYTQIPVIKPETAPNKPKTSTSVDSSKRATADGHLTQGASMAKTLSKKNR